MPLSYEKRRDEEVRVLNSYVPPGFEEQAKQIAIDFDGVLHNDDKGWHDGTCYGEPLPGALGAVQKLSKKYTIVIFTAKVKGDRPLVNGKTGMQLVKAWLRKWGFEPYVKEITCEKPRAQYYIDDKAIRFDSWGQMEWEDLWE